MTDWREQGACWQSEAAVFFPRNGPVGIKESAKAKEVCAACPITAECLAFALENFSAHYDWGVWGGTSPKERRALRTRQPVSAFCRVEHCDRPSKAQGLCRNHYMRKKRYGHPTAFESKGLVGAVPVKGSPRTVPAYVGSQRVTCACGAEARVNNGLLAQGQTTLETCVECAHVVA